MKKGLKAAVFLLVFLLASAAICTGVRADSRYYDITGYTVHVVINPDGSADVEESITYDFTGEFNGVLRDIDYERTDGIANLRVFVEEDGINVREFTVNSTTDYDAAGDPGTYNIYHDDEIAHLKVFEKSRNTRKTFVYKYTLENVVTRFNDIAEFNRRIIDANWDVPLNDIRILIRLPEGASEDEIMVFGHGPLTGESRIIDAQNVEFILDRLHPGYYVETLVLFPTRLVPGSTRVVSEDALQRILENEKKLADEANRERDLARRQVEEYNRRLEEERRRLQQRRTITNAVSIALFLAWIPLIIRLYLKYDREFRSTFNAKYYRELPGEYTPAEMSVLMNMGSVNKRDITATLMDLVRRGYLILKKETYIKEGFFRDKEVEDYSLTLNPEAPTSGLLSHESCLINWFIKKIGDGSRVFLDEISGHVKTEADARRFTKNYQNWCGMVRDEAGKHGFFDESSQKGKSTAIIAGILYVFLGFFLVAAAKGGLGFLIMISGFVMLIFGARLNRRSVYGNEQYAMWKAFRNFLKDFSRLDKAEMPSIVLWEHYLVYAVSLGVAKEVIKQLPLVYTDADLQNARLTYMYGHDLRSLSYFTSALDRTVDSVDHAINRAMAIANSKQSSSSGKGGGFSGGGFGGGSGGGGGRGGGGAF
ncbi:MAG: DUF2207 domain-containing protein [Clostridiaceae bacterium]|nr:DUF2207 domain-containing protein [Clostridiaceae bacterium]